MDGMRVGWRVDVGAGVRLGVSVAVAVSDGGMVAVGGADVVAAGTLMVVGFSALQAQSSSERRNSNVVILVPYDERRIWIDMRTPDFVLDAIV